MCLEAKRQRVEDICIFVPCIYTPYGPSLENTLIRAGVILVRTVYIYHIWTIHSRSCVCNCVLGGEEAARWGHGYICIHVHTCVCKCARRYVCTYSYLWCEYTWYILVYVSIFGMHIYSCVCKCIHFTHFTYVSTYVYTL